MDDNDTQAQIDELQNEVKSLQGTIEDMKTTFEKHSHFGTDGSRRLKVTQQPQEDAQIGCAFIDSFEAVGANTALSPGLGGTPTDFLAYLIAGKENPETSNAYPSTQVVLDYQYSTNGGNNYSFLFAQRPPLFTGTGISISSGSSLMTDASQNWGVNALAGAWVNFYDTTGSFQTRKIVSNTAQTLTLATTWATSVSGGAYITTMPVFLGAADWPWRRGYFIGEDVSSGQDGSQMMPLRFGFGATGGANSTGVFYGLGSPESVVTAQVGSFYLRTDGSTSTVLYVKETGTGNTGWIAYGAPASSAPSGSMLAFGAAAAPTGWLLCDGTAVSRTTYAALFAVIGTNYGIGDGSTTFNLPDGRANVLAGYKASDTNFGTLGASVGSPTHTLTTAELPVHAHLTGGDNALVSKQNNGGASGGTSLISVTSPSGSTNFKNTDTAGSGTAHSIVQASLTVNWIIKT